MPFSYVHVCPFKIHEDLLYVFIYIFHSLSLSASSFPRDLCVELLLHVPVQLKHLQAYNMLGELRHLTRPLVLALQGSDELGIFGLTTLEYLIDSINIEFLEPMLADCMPDLLKALFALLKPQNLNLSDKYNFSIKAMSILGKLGGRNRRVLQETLPATVRPGADTGVRLKCCFEPECFFGLPLQQILPAIYGAIRNEPLPVTLVKSGQRSLHHRQQALESLQTCICTLLNMRPLTEALTNGESVDKLREALFGKIPAPAAPVAAAARAAAGAPAAAVAAQSGPSSEGTAAPTATPTAAAPLKPRPTPQRVRTKAQWEVEKETISSLLASLMHAAADPALSETALPFAQGVIRHVALLVATGAFEAAFALQQAQLQAQQTAAEGGDADAAAAQVFAPTERRHSARLLQRSVEVSGTCDALLRQLASTKKAERETAAELLGLLLSTLAAVHLERKRLPEPTDAMDVDPEAAPAKRPGSVSIARDDLPPLTEELLGLVLHSCHARSWQTALGGIRALDVMLAQLPAPVAATLVAASFAGEGTQKCTRAVLFMIDHLPTHAFPELQASTGVLGRLLKLTIGVDPFEVAETAAAPEAADAPPTVDAAAAAAAAAAGTAVRQVVGVVADALHSRTNGAYSMALHYKILQAVARISGQSIKDLILERENEPTPAKRLKVADRVTSNLKWLRNLGGIVGLVQHCVRAPTQLHTKEVVSVLTSLRYSLQIDGQLMGVLARADAGRLVMDIAVPLAELDDKLQLNHPDAAALLQGIAVLPSEAVVELRAAAIHLLAAYVEGEAETVRNLPAAQVPVAASAQGTSPKAAEGSAAAAAGKEDVPAAAEEKKEESAVVAAVAAASAVVGDKSAASAGSAGAKSGSAPLTATSLPPLLERFGGVLLHALLSSHPEVVEAATGACALLRRMMVTPTDQPTEMRLALRPYLRRILHDLTNLPALNLAMVRGIKRIIACVPGVVNESLGDHVLKVHLERHKGHLTMLNSMWEPNEEPLIAAAFIDLFEMFTEPKAASLVESQDGRSGLVVLTIQTEQALLRAFLQQTAHHIGKGPIPLCNGRLQSPYRVPMTRYLIKNQEACLKYFLDRRRFDKANYFPMYLDLIKSEDGAPLLDYVASQPRRILEAADLRPRADAAAAAAAEPHVDPFHRDAGPENESHFAFNGIHLLSTIVKRRPLWIKDQAEVMEVVLQRWRSDRRTHRASADEHHSRHKLLETKRLAKVIIAYLRCNPAQATLAFDLLAVFHTDPDNRSRVDYTFVRDFLTKDLLAMLSEEESRVLFQQFLADMGEVRSMIAALAEGPAPITHPASAAKKHPKLQQLLERLIFAMRYIIRPMADMEAAVHVKGISPKLWFEFINLLNALSDIRIRGASGGHKESAAHSAPGAGAPGAGGAASSSSSGSSSSLGLLPEALHIELLQFATMVIGKKDAGLDLKRGEWSMPPNREHKKDLVRYGWWHLKGDDLSPCRYHGYLYVSQFVVHFKGPDRIALQVYVALLNCCQVESRGVVRQALDILLPNMSTILKESSQKDKWWRYVKKTIMEGALCFWALVPERLFTVFLASFCS